MSVLPPVAKGTTRVTGLVGYVCAVAMPLKNSPMTPANSRTPVLIFIPSSQVRIHHIGTAATLGLEPATASRGRIMMSCRLLVTSCAIGCFATLFACAASAKAIRPRQSALVVASSAASNPDTVPASSRMAPVRRSVSRSSWTIAPEPAATSEPKWRRERPRILHGVPGSHQSHDQRHALQKLTYDLLNDFAPITLLALSLYVGAVHPSCLRSQWQELVAVAKSRPRDIFYASAGVGSGTFFVAEYFNSVGKVKMLHAHPITVEALP